MGHSPVARDGYHELMVRVRIRGDGIAACCCDHLLTKAGFSVKTDRVARPRLPAIMLSDAAAALIRDVFGRDDLFRELPRITKRVVAWGVEASPVTLDHSAVVVSEDFLLGSVRSGDGATFDNETTNWEIFTSKPLPSPATEHRFGSRTARVSKVRLQGEGATCWIESREYGWLFLLPSGDGMGWLLSVGEAELSGSRLIAGQISEVQSFAGEFPAHPRMMTPLCGPGWIACGTAAMAFDPLCGDGTANAVREAILASAVIQAVRNGGDRDALFSHYETRLTAGFQKHLSLSTSFYQSGSAGDWWEAELAALKDGLAWCTERSSGLTDFKYRLNGFELEAVR
jgi:hypothetical protein